MAVRAITGTTHAEVEIKLALATNNKLTNLKGAVPIIVDGPASPVAACDNVARFSHMDERAAGISKGDARQVARYTPYQQY